MFEQYDSKNVVIVDKNGEVIYFTNNNLPLYDLTLENSIGRQVTSLYKNLHMDNSSMISAIKTGKSFLNLKQELKTQRDNSVYQIGSTYPLIEDNKIIGAIEFADIVDENNSINNEFYKQDISYKENGTCYTIDGPFISQNCGAIPANLLESILFGTTKGSFTGAENKEGLFELAKGGTLFLDEINSLDLVSQVKILKVIEEKRIRRIGGAQEIPLDIRIIVALNENPEKLIEESRMRADLYYRISVVHIVLPDLTFRKDDIELLSDYYIERFNRELGFNIKSISDELLAIFKEYHWPGNIRELRNVIEGGFNTIIKDQFTIKDIPKRIFESKKTGVIGVLENSNYNLKSYLENHEKSIVLEAYKTHQNNLSLAAASLKISKQLLRYKLDKYNI